MAAQDAGNIVDLFLSKKDFRLLLVIENLSKVEKAAKGHDSTAVGMGMDINAVHRALSQDNDTLSYKFLKSSVEELTYAFDPDAALTNTIRVRIRE